MSENKYNDSHPQNKESWRKQQNSWHAFGSHLMNHIKNIILKIIQTQIPHQNVHTIIYIIKYFVPTIFFCIDQFINISIISIFFIFIFKYSRMLYNCVLSIVILS